MRTALDIEDQKYRDMEGWGEEAIAGTEPAPTPAPVCGQCEHWSRTYRDRGKCTAQVWAEDGEWRYPLAWEEDPAEDCSKYKEDCPF